MLLFWIRSADMITFQGLEYIIIGCTDFQNVVVFLGCILFIETVVFFVQHFTPNFGGCILYTTVCNKQDFTVKAKGIWKSLVCNLSIMVVGFFFTKHVDITIDRKIGYLTDLPNNRNLSVDHVIDNQ